MVVNYLPVASEMATKWYVEQVPEAGCGSVNCIPVFIASQEYWAGRFKEHGVPIIGDDIKSQVGETIDRSRRRPNRTQGLPAPSPLARRLMPTARSANLRANQCAHLGVG